MAFRTDDGWQGSIAGMLKRWALTGFLIFLLLVISAFPFKFGNFDQIQPAFALMAVYYFVIMRPSLFPPVAVFIIGIAFDLMEGMPLGANALVFVLAQWVTRSQRKVLMGQSFIVLWLGMALLALGAGTLKWVVYSLFYYHFDIWALRPMLVSVIVTIAVFPLFVLPLSALNKSLADH